MQCKTHLASSAPSIANILSMRICTQGAGTEWYSNVDGSLRATTCDSILLKAGQRSLCLLGSAWERERERETNRKENGVKVKEKERGKRLSRKCKTTLNQPLSHHAVALQLPPLPQDQDQRVPDETPPSSALYSRGNNDRNDALPRLPSSEQAP